MSLGWAESGPRPLLLVMSTWAFAPDLLLARAPAWSKRNKYGARAGIKLADARILKSSQPTHRVASSKLSWVLYLYITFGEVI